MRKQLICGWISVLLLVGLPKGSVIAQNINSADVQFELQAYELAIESYLNILQSEPQNIHAITQLAKSYDRTNDLINAARWYDKLFMLDSNTDDELIISYGKVLKSLGLYDKAREIFRSCQDPYWHGIGNNYARNCDFAESMMKTEDVYEVFLFDACSSNADFAPSIWKDQLVFASYETDPIVTGQPENTLIHAELNRLYVSGLDRKTAGSTKNPLGSDLFEQEGISSLSFSDDGTKVLFTRNNFRNTTRQINGNEKGLSIYMASIDEGGNFYNEFALPFNSTDYSVAFACFGQDTNTIFFASNMEGEHTDFDLFKSTHNGIEWGEAVNLGSTVNTSGNEICPYFAENNLFFSSDMHSGMGGYDVFRTQKSGENWSLPINVGKGINSIADDLYLVWNKATNEYFYSSNRLGGKGNFDIYVSIPKYNNNNEADLLSARVGNEPPKEVSLSSLRDIHSKNTRYSEAGVVAYEDNIMAPDDISLEGAVMVAYGEVVNTSSRVYFVQLASLATTRGNVGQFSSLVEFGNVYRVKKNASFKIRLGYFHDETEAKSILAQVKRKGFNDAFIVEDLLDIRELELLLSSFTFHSNQKYQKPEIESEYKVRLAAYSNPLYFDTEKVKDIGVIEQWSKDKWTIFLLGGYVNIEEANQARIKAINRGFTGAELVRDDNGILTRVKNN